MKLSEFIKEKILQIVLLMIVIITIEIFLLIYEVGEGIKIYIAVAILLAYGVGILEEYYQKNKFYKQIKKYLEELDKKYLIAELIKDSSFVEGKILKEILEQTDKSMLEKINSYKYRQEEYKEYIELWIHEIKMPIATSKMIIENNQNEITKNIEEEIDKIDNFVEQALFYARSNNVEKDYIIKKVKIKEMVNSVLKKNKKDLIGKKIKITLENINQTVNTDHKWMQFIINQILQNCIKYRKEENMSEIKIEAKENKDNIVLIIEDNGIGIKEEEQEKVFEKGYTGSNGRKTVKSTGIGLYLCKALCIKLGHNIELISKEGEGTKVKLIFPKNSLTMS